MPVGQHLKLRCFLEGIEVPIISAALSVQADSPAQCQIQIPATDRAHEFLPRTLVHVFFRDFWDGPGDHISVLYNEPPQVQTSEEQAAQANQSEQQARANTDALQSERDGTEPEITPSGAAVRRSSLSGETTSASPHEDSPADPNPELTPANTGGTAAGPTHAGNSVESEMDPPETEDRRWKLYFCGEVTGYTFMKSHGQRSIILSCLDPSVYWDTCYQYKVNTSSLTGDGMANFVGAGTQLFDEFFESSTSILVQILQRNSVSRPELTGLLAGVVHLLERVGGVYRSRGFRGVNDFFSLAELRLHLIDMITASERDESSRRMVARNAYNRFMRQQGGQLGKIASFREILTMINRFMFHNVFANPIAKFDDPSSRTETRRVTSSLPLSRTRHGARLLQAINAGIDLANAALTADSPSRAATIMESFAPVVRSADASAIALRLNDISEELYRASDLGTRARRSYAGNQASTGERQTRDAREILRNMRSRVSGESRTTSRNSTRTVTDGARLNSQIIRPDVWMVSPPRCNVLFPELYNSVQFQRQFMREVSRMRLTVTDEIFGSDSLLNQWYYAPDVEVLGERMRQLRGGGLGAGTLRQNAYTRRLMDHELFTGIVPVFERMNEVNIYSARSDPVSVRGARVPFVTRAAHFQFFKHRFTPRQIQVGGKFNPYAVAGFPALVIDRHMTEEQLIMSNMRGLDDLDVPPSQLDRTEGTADLSGATEVNFTEDEVITGQPAADTTGEPPASPASASAAQDVWRMLRENSPTQMIGMIVSMQHTVGQSQANTNYVLQYARTHRENDELLGSNVVTLGRRDAGTATRTTVVAAPSGDPPRVGQMGPYFGTITSVTPVNRTGEFLLFGTFLPQNVRQRGRQARREVRVVVGVRQQVASYPAEVTRNIGGLADDLTREIEFSPYEIVEEVERVRGDEVAVPFEDFVRPPWMSDVWKNDRIGATYQQFFGTGAITDDLIVYTGSNSESESPAGDSDLETPIRQADAESRASGDPTDWQLADGGTVQEAEMALNVERAVDLLVRAYSELRHEDLDIQEFIRGYTWRPVADLLQMLGSRDLEINPETGEATAGNMGFHSLAFGHGPTGQNVRNLTRSSEADTILGIDADRDRSNVLSRLDKRADKANRVMQYVKELWNDRGQLG